MKSINVVFDDVEFDRVRRAKGSCSWREAIVKWAEKAEARRCLENGDNNY